MKTPIRILVVDDDADVARATCRTLDQAGYATIAASTGAQVLPALREQPAHLVLLDRQLPDVDGLEICRQIKADLMLGRVLVVIITGVHKGIEDRVAGWRPGPTATLSGRSATASCWRGWRRLSASCV